MPEEPVAPPVIVSEPTGHTHIPVAEAKRLTVLPLWSLPVAAVVYRRRRHAFLVIFHPLTGPLCSRRACRYRETDVTPCLNSPRICRCIAEGGLTPQSGAAAGKHCYHCRYPQRRAGDGRYADELGTALCASGSWRMTCGCQRSDYRQAALSALSDPK